MERSISFRRVLIILAVINVVVIAVMKSYDPQLKPYGILAFEFAGNVATSQEMVMTWENNGVLNSVFFLIGFDYLFMITYSMFLGLACWRVSKQFNGRIASFLYGLAWLQPVAALLDATENAALYQMASYSMNELWPVLSYYCAMPKFIIALSGLLGSAIGALVVVFKRIK